MFVSGDIKISLFKKLWFYICRLLVNVGDRLRELKKMGAVYPNNHAYPSHTILSWDQSCSVGYSGN